MSDNLNKQEKLKSKKLIERLFDEGQTLSSFPLRIVYLQTKFDDAANIKIGVSVSKRNFKNAVDRNRIKRLMRESYRLNESHYFNNTTTQYALMILYIGIEKPTYNQVNEAMVKLLNNFSASVLNT